MLAVAVLATCVWLSPNALRYVQFYCMARAAGLDAYEKTFHAVMASCPWTPEERYGQAKEGIGVAVVD